MAHRNVGFLEARKIFEKWPQPWRSNPAFSSDAGSLRGYVEANMRNFPSFKTPRNRREWDNIETIESIKTPSQVIGWNPGRNRWKITTDNSRTQISEQSLSNVEKFEQFKKPDSVREIFRRVGVHSDGGRSQLREH
jgi:hypothetical protein